MSTTSTKRPLHEAIRDAQAFRELFDGCFCLWEVAGSVRRRKPEVGDVEHVIRPSFADVADPASMFGEKVRTNLLWRRLDHLVAAGEATRHQYETHLASGQTVYRERWGDAYRGVSFRGYLHELFTADADNWGCILTIRTGPGEFSQRMVTALHGTMLRQKDGYLRYADGKVYACPDERAFFAACRAEWKEPQDR